MSVFYEAKIGYGYPVYGDDFPDYDCDDDASMDAYWKRLLTARNFPTA